MAPRLPYGTWPSPLTADVVAAGSVQMEMIALDEGNIYWLERRPNEQGRHVVVRQAPDGSIADVTPEGTNVRTRVHEYGGGACTIHDGVLYYSNDTDQRLYRLTPGEAPVVLTPPGPWRYADGVVDWRRRRFICVREDHSGTGVSGHGPVQEPRNTLVSIPLDAPRPSEGTVLAEGYDFYSAPRLNPAGDRLAWVCWRHPQMPWDGTDLFVATVRPDGMLAEFERIAGGEREAIVQPHWSPDGVLYFVSDRTGWWNHYRFAGGSIEPLLPTAADFVRPPWELGLRMSAFAGSSRMVVALARDGVWKLGVLDLESKVLHVLENAPAPASVILATDTHAIYVGRSPKAPDAVVRVDLTSAASTAIRRASEPVLDPSFISEPRQMSFPTDDGEMARLFYYAPLNPSVALPEGERPPLILMSHGGPTSAADTRLNLVVQFWTTRGFAVADVDYRGSSGYGRAYRERLNGEWGVVDVADCVNAARFLASEGLADPERLIIRGGSAGGFTTLAALTFRAGVFKAGACYYGIGDLEALARETHKFEARYTDRLIAPYPERADVYRDRSPIRAVGQLSCPVIFFHGREDRAVPVSQSEQMAEASRRKGLRADLFVFEGEQHGFRRKETIAACLNTELRFYGEVFGFQPAS